MKRASSATKPSSCETSIYRGDVAMWIRSFTRELEDREIF